MSDSSYDQLPYEDYSFPRSHPEHLCAVARLYGHPAPDVARARVLEIGCAAGGNLLPMAQDLTGAVFVGIDLSARQIEAGASVLSRTGLTNATLRAMSVMDVDDSLGTFDYVICHGVYSWVPPEVRAAILEVCRARLAPEGVAYVSYNVLPGFASARTVRDFLLFHVPREEPPAKRVALARRALTLFEPALRAQATPASELLANDIAGLAREDDAYLFHEYLEEVNEPMYFRDFARDAAAHGLAHVTDADVTSTPQAVLGGITPRGDGAGDPLALEQYVDFLRNRRFRASLLAREDGFERRAPTLQHLAGLFVATRAELAQPSTEAALRTHAPLAFTLSGGARFELAHPLAKCAVVTLCEAQRRPIAFTELCARAAKRAGITASAAAQVLLAGEFEPLRLVFAGALEVRTGPARYAEDAGLRPTAPPLARDQAARGKPVTTLRHQQLDVPAFERAVLARLDGTRDRASLAEELAREVREGRLAGDAKSVARRCEEALEWLCLNALVRE